jgi:hypothetical protein
VIALVMDALQHPGLADPARIDRAVCGRVFASGIDPERATLDIATAVVDALVRTKFGPQANREPPLRPYALSAQRR